MPTCEKCGADFTPKARPYKGRPPQRWCSTTCSLAARWGAIVGARPCKTCGAIIAKPVNRKTAFCSLACRYKSQQGTIHEERRKRVVVPCGWCSTPIERRPCEVRGEHSFCSEPCSSQWQSANIRGFGHPRWAGGSPKSGYGGGWRAKRKSALRRANGLCEKCGGAARDVHHRIPVRCFATHAEAHVETNLIALCRPCHDEAHREIRALNAHLPKPSKSGPFAAA